MGPGRHYRPNPWDLGQNAGAKGGVGFSQAPQDKKATEEDQTRYRYHPGVQHPPPTQIGAQVPDPQILFRTSKEKDNTKESDGALLGQDPGGAESPTLDT